LIAELCTDAAGNTISETKAAGYSCDENGNCAATISVKEGARVNWNVQSICSINGVTVYSPKVEGREAFIPYCQAITSLEKTNSSAETIRVYPNPTTGYLTVEFSSKAEGNTGFTVLDMSGKKVYYRSAGEVNKTNSGYQLDLHGLSSGAYLLEVHNGKEVSRVKFVLFRN
jgi:hypothetical protein